MATVNLDIGNWVVLGWNDGEQTKMFLTLLDSYEDRDGVTWVRFKGKIDILRNRLIDEEFLFSTTQLSNLPRFTVVDEEAAEDMINTIEERIALSAVCDCKGHNSLYAINDLVIDRGRWPKMIQIHLAIDGREVSSFSADGIIIATPTGSTGYSLSTGGPIVSPRSSSITISPISPHTLNMRPLVLSSNQKIDIKVYSPTKIQVSTDGQRVHYYDSPLSLSVKKAENNIKLFHTKDFNYFELLRKKLFWGLDVRKNEE